MTQKRKKILFILTAILVLLQALISCTTTQVQQQIKPVQIDSTFPDPIDENGNSIVTYDSESQTVSMPLWYWLKITEFAIDVNTNKILQN